MRNLLLMAALLPLGVLALDPATLPNNTWHKISEETDANKILTSIWYMPTTGEFINWGRNGSVYELSKKYDVETFTFASGRWSDSYPIGKETSWANGKFPNWNTHGFSVPASWTGPSVPGVVDMGVSGFSYYNKVSWVRADGVDRPTRCPTFHQGCFDTKRGRMFYFVGGKTFAYNATTRIWTDLNPATTPQGCEALVWATLCYDPVNDQVVLFGGGMALNTWGGAKTWIYDCASNEWRRPILAVEPPLRCNTRLVYDSRNKVMVMFGGDAQTKALNDTWIYDVTRREWSERIPAKAPPAAFRVAAAFVESVGVVLICGCEEASRTASTWTYNAATNVWTPVKGTLPAFDWLTCDYSSNDDTVLMVGTGSVTWIAPRVTYAYRLSPATAAESRPGAAPNTPIYKDTHERQRVRMAAAPPPNRTATEDAIRNMANNIWFEANCPGPATIKTWSDCTIDTDAGVVLYTGGGHSGYSGSDVAHYDVGTNRWSLSFDPEFAPYLEGTNRTVFGWSYHLHPWSEHTRRWYAYDPVSKTMVYARQGTDFRGKKMYLGQDAQKEIIATGSEMWVYDPAKKKYFEPTFDREWGTNDATCLVTTPTGVYAVSSQKVWKCTVTRSGTGNDENAVAAWTLVNSTAPYTGSELDATVYDSKRNRLVTMTQRATGPEMWFFSLSNNTWTKGTYTGQFTPTREVCYIPGQDVIFQDTYQIDGETTKTQIFRCATNEWVQSTIPYPTTGYGFAGWDTSMAYDPVHNCVVMIDRFYEPSIVHLLRYVETNAPAGILQEPQDLTVFVGATATFNVVASGYPLPTFQWQEKPPSAANFTNIAGATSHTLTRTNAALAMSGTRYRCVVSNSLGSATSRAALMQVIEQPPPPNSPVIQKHPEDAGVSIGETATFSVVATGSGPLAYQWQKFSDGIWTSIAGARSASYTTPAAAASDNKSRYRCAVSNSAGSVISAAATLMVWLPPEMMSEPTATPNPAALNQMVTFSANAADPNDELLTFTWVLGDGATGTGETATHAYTAAGVYDVQLTVGDGRFEQSRTLQVRVLPNEDGGGGGGGSGQRTPMKITKAAVKLNFTAPAGDSISINGELPPVEQFSAGGQAITVSVGTFVHSFTLDKKGKARAFRLSGRAKSGIYNGALKFSYKTSKVDLKNALAPLGFINATIQKPGANVALPVTIDMAGRRYFASCGMVYTAITAKSGSAKFTRRAPGK